MSHVLLFDLDETLYPPEAGVMDYIRERMKAYVCQHLSLSPADADLLRQKYLREYGTTLRGLQLNHQIDAEEYLRYVHDVPLTRCLKANPELDGVLAGIHLEKVLFTNASREHAERVLSLLGVRRRFSRIVDVRDMNYESKPQPAAYRGICDMLCTRPQDCLIVEDSLRNLLPAKALGMTTVLVGGSQPASSDGVDVVIRRVEDIGEALAGLGLIPRGTERATGDGGPA